SLEKAGLFIRHAAASGADIICFPEQFATGWDPASHQNLGDADSGILPALRKYARDADICILGSLRERASPCPRNTAIAIGRDGSILATYAKIHLFSPGEENKSFTAGTELGIFSVGSLKCGIAICYDLRFPELFSAYAARGVQAVIVPAAWPAVRLRHWEIFITSRAAENQMYVIGVNTTGTTPVDTYAGASMAADPSGTIISRAGDAEQLIFTDIDPALADTTRAAFPVARDRRNALYRDLG
ncbi:MAG: carbon-nitrogen hydrolase family protein, partial [Methanomicrobiales archaeon]|nr:carbon-nitrogen hydrolase family protein [Methanomicrobiales archaeon]